MTGLPETPPLSLYIHTPWCVQKCPYCDFNSHAVVGELNEYAYVDALLRDLNKGSEPFLSNEEFEDGPTSHKKGSDPLLRELISIFIGGGTPSLFSGAAIARLLDGVRDRYTFAQDIEISIEANPGTVDRQHFQDYRQAGVNRISIGAQSFDREQLQALGRIHGSDEIMAAVTAARAAGFANLNLDIMYGLPGQTLAAARADIAKAISLGPEHISYYQLTIEPNTRFHVAPPAVPDDDLLWEIETQGHELLAAAGYRQYEVSGFARAGYECRHNRNYWEFGDYLGMGAGAHGKLSDFAHGKVMRTRKPKSPDAYIKGTQMPSALEHIEQIAKKDRALEFMLNALRLTQGFHPDLFERRTGCALSSIQTELDAARKDGLLDVSAELIRPTPKGRAFLNDVLALFMPNE